MHMARKAQLTTSRSGRPKETLLAPNVWLTPSSSRTPLMVSRVALPAVQSEPTVSARLSKLYKIGVIKDTRKVGKAKFYQLNGESPVVQKIDHLVTTISMSVALEQVEDAHPLELVSEDVHVDK